MSRRLPGTPPRPAEAVPGLPPASGRGYRGYHSPRPLGPNKGPSGGLITSKVRRKSVRLRGRHAGWQFERGVALLDEVQKLRADCRESVLSFARELGRRVNWADGTTFDERGRRCQAAGRSVTTWKWCRRLLDDAGCLPTVSEGCIRWDDHGGVRYDAAVYVLCLPRRIIRKMAVRRGRATAHRITRPPSEKLQVNHIQGRAASGAGQVRDGPPCGRAAHPGRPRNAELAAGGGAAGAIAAALRRAAGQDLSDGWCGWFARRFAAAGWTPAEVETRLSRVPHRSEWDPLLRAMPPAGALMVLLAGTGARHWSPGWLAMRPAPHRQRAADAAVAKAAQRRARAAAEAARAEAEATGGPASRPEYQAWRRAFLEQLAAGGSRSAARELGHPDPDPRPP